MTVQADLKILRQQLERLQVEVNGRKALGAITVWDGQKTDSVNSIPDDFNGLVVHLEPDASPSVETQTIRKQGVSQNELAAIKEAIVRQQLVDSQT